jgi:hypothetical protein
MIYVCDFAGLESEKLFSSGDRNTIGLEETRGYQPFDNIFIQIAKTVCLSKETRFSQKGIIT